MSVGTAMDVGGASKDWRFRCWVLPRSIEKDGVSGKEAEDSTVAILIIVDNRQLPRVVLNGRFIVAIDVNDEKLMRTLPFGREPQLSLVTDYFSSGSTASLWL